jgi:hypothetical protein
MNKVYFVIHFAVVIRHDKGNEKVLEVCIEVGKHHIYLLNHHGGHFLS